MSRDKFTQWIEQGITGFFRHDPVAPSVPTSCPITRRYNNAWGALTDTHASVVCGKNGGYKIIITGTFISRPGKWNSLLYAANWGGFVFASTGYTTLADFLHRNHLDYQLVIINGQDAIELVPVNTVTGAPLDNEEWDYQDEEKTTSPFPQATTGCPGIPQATTGCPGC